jgi:C_GCAxxG_C_C family probable redox protein
MNEKRLDVEELYIGKNMNCAESTLSFINEKAQLGIGSDDLRIIGGFGAGMGCGKTCGALAAGIAAISALLIEKRAHDVPGFRGICADYVARFEKEFGGTDCAELKKKYFREGVRCAELVNANAELLESFLEELRG